MTVQYDGNEHYTIFTGNRELILHKSEIDELQSYDFETGLESLTVSELNDKIEDLEEVEKDFKAAQRMIESLEEDVNELEEEIYILRKELEQYD